MPQTDPRISKTVDEAERIKIRENGVGINSMNASLRTFLVAILLFSPSAVRAADAVPITRAIAFPTDASLTFTDDYGDPRSGHPHIGIDILGPKMTPLYSAIDGVVRYVVIPEASWGYEIVLQDADGWSYHYIHVNNDTPGTDDDLGGPEHAYAPGIERGAVVHKGQLVGWMGDSGNAEDVTSHLHFEIHQPDDTPIDPYPSLVAARYPGTYSAADAKAASPTINVDKNLATTNAPPCVSGSLIKPATLSAVYYCGADGKRYVFPNDRIYFSWYADFKNVTTISDAQLASIVLGGLVTYRPGVKMVKLESLPNVYAVDHGGVLRWIKNPTIAVSIYGTAWNKNVDDLSDAFFGSYTIGEPITGVR